ncbi:hypothetical protein MTF65_17365 [Streptomyces sp. APSN-46.1]|uniref:hypothetical protein n=1 Tax=Streptomyces sp. APSN-46.1 TaxID=2929049 RepID=UPI001FB3D8FE|nr:hypothetical protein [Streptomyces sp. APSN-46.1]MCJ1679075.1 hypothetical protein [Streptomyces sp. APSN-46.1]
MQRTKPFRVRVLVPSALAVVILSGAAAPASALDSGDRAVAPRAAAGPIDDLVKGILDSIAALLPPGISLPDIKIPDIKIPEVKLPEIKLPEIPGVELPEIPGVEIPEIPGLEPPTLQPPAELVPEIPEIPEIGDVPEIPDIPALT